MTPIVRARGPAPAHLFVVHLIAWVRGDGRRAMSAEVQVIEDVGLGPGATPYAQVGRAQDLFHVRVLALAL